MSRLLLTSCLLAVTAIGMPALAQSNARQANDPSVRVVVSDLDLSDPADAREFHRRTAKAARSLCRQVSQEPLIAQQICQQEVKAIVQSDLSPSQQADLASRKKKDNQDLADRGRGQPS